VCGAEEELDIGPGELDGHEVREDFAGSASDLVSIKAPATRAIIPTTINNDLFFIKRLFLSFQQ
jgi:hypothetical protein